MLVEASIAETECATPGPTMGVRRHRASKLHKASVGVHDHAARPVLTTSCGWRYGGVPHVIEQLGDSTGAFAALRCYRGASRRTGPVLRAHASGRTRASRRRPSHPSRPASREARMDEPAMPHGIGPGPLLHGKRPT